jgi:hypothetical protein
VYWKWAINQLWAPLAGGNSFPVKMMAPWISFRESESPGLLHCCFPTHGGHRHSGVSISSTEWGAEEHQWSLGCWKGSMTEVEQNF